MEKKQLHVAMLISALGKGGTERVLVNLSDYLISKGFQVTVVTQYQKDNEYSLNPKVKRIISDLTKEECTKRRILNFIRRFKKLRKIWKQEHPDVILSFIGKNNMMAILTSRFLKIPVAVAVRGDPMMEYYLGWMRFAAKNLFRLADGVILQTKQSFDFFPKAVRKKAVILRNPINPAFFIPRYAGEREKTIVAVGRIDENKNHKLLIRAFAGIAEKYPEYQLIIYGEGELKEKLKELTASLGMEGKISFPGAISNVQEAIYKASVFVLPSNTEGVPNTLIEAMILGLTVIATDCPCGGPADLIDHGINGLLTQVGNVEQMKDNLQKVLNNLQYANILGINALRTGDIYLPESVYKEWEAYMNSLVFRRK